MALYDNLPLNTPTKVFDDGVDLAIWATRTSDPAVGGSGTVENRFYPSGPTATTNANRDTLNSNIANALTRLRQIQTQTAAGKTSMATINAKANYGTNAVANLNDLLATVKTLAQALGVNANGANVFDALNDIATDLIGACRIMSGQYDGTT